ncbi:PEP-CTERM sorting domain-containing protein [Rubritalea sp.]|uniref:PEP-CTERM sorting domain-containing protein n=1 Tax=Rubritalea sp. TaxID=2109375 RepID=UPI003EF2085A
MKKLLIPLLALAATMPSYGSLVLDFSNFDANTSVVTSGGVDTVSYGIVATDGEGTDIYARLVSNANASYYAAESNFSEIRMPVDNSITFTLSLYGDSSYNNLYDPAALFDWSLMFADIEGGGAGSAYEKLTIATAGTYTLASNTFLAVTVDGNGTTFDAQGQAIIDNPTSSTTSLTESQSQGAIRYSIIDSAEIEFTYTAIDNARSAFVYGGNLAFFSEGTTTTTAVPEPSSTALLGLGGLALIMRRRK